MSILERLAAFIAPDDCLACGREGSLLCRQCLLTLPVVPGHCFGCQTATGSVACAACLQATRLDSLTAACHYRGSAKHLIATLKFSGNQSAARIIATGLAPLLPATGLLMHMPATNAHVRERGYDQSRLITRELCRITGLPCCNVLRRSGSHHQLGANREQRLKQMTSSLSLSNAAKVSGKNIILIDDVLTTGSSLTAAAQLLHKAGATRIDGFTFAQSIEANK